MSYLASHNKYFTTLQWVCYNKKKVEYGNMVTVPGFLFFWKMKLGLIFGNGKPIRVPPQDE